MKNEKSILRQASSSFVAPKRAEVDVRLERARAENMLKPRA